MAASLSTEQAIKLNQGDSPTRVSEKFSFPGSDLGGVELFTAVDAPNKNIEISEGLNTYNPCEGPEDYGRFKTRVISFAAKSTNANDIIVASTHDADDGDTMTITLRPGSGFLLVSPYAYESQVEVNENTEIAVSGTGTDYYSAFWAIG